MVALDGAFATFPIAPSQEAWSPKDQAAAFAEGCADAGLELMLYQPNEPGHWFGHVGNEVEKRNASVRLAGVVMGADWVFNVDPDMILERYGDARKRMARTGKDSVWCDVEGIPTRNIYRYSDGLRHWRSHWIVINENGMLSGPRDPDRGLGGYPPLLEPFDLRDTIQFGHPEKKDYWRRARQKLWYEYRDGEAKLEEW